jgi:hypothetical protein
MGFEIDICNLALSRVNGCNSIKSLTEQSREAIQCNILYPFVRNFTLSEYEWPFARRTDALELTTETDVKYANVYKKPPNCLTAIRIYNPASDATNPPNCSTNTQSLQFATGQKIDFGQGINSTGNFATILTNEASAYLVYVSKVFIDSVFPQKFIDALAWRLASELAVPLKGSQELADSFAKRFQAALTSAGARSLNEEYTTPTSESDFLNSRL